MAHLPNILTSFRIVCVPIVLLFTVIGTPVADTIACGVFIIAGITDYLDGRLARSYQQQSELGRILDPIADKILVSACLMVLAGLQRLPYESLWPAIVILCREITVAGLREFLANKNFSLKSTLLSKWKTGIQMTAIGFLLAGHGMGLFLNLTMVPFAEIGAILLWIAALLTIITGWDYLHKGFGQIK